MLKYVAYILLFSLYLAVLVYLNRCYGILSLRTWAIERIDPVSIISAFTMTFPLLYRYSRLSSLTGPGVASGCRFLITQNLHANAQTKGTQVYKNLYHQNLLPKADAGTEHQNSSESSLNIDLSRLASVESTILVFDVTVLTCLGLRRSYLWLGSWRWWCLSYSWKLWCYLARFCWLILEKTFAIKLDLQKKIRETDAQFCNSICCASVARCFIYGLRKIGQASNWCNFFDCWSDSTYRSNLRQLLQLLDKIYSRKTSVTACSNDRMLCHRSGYCFQGIAHGSEIPMRCLPSFENLTWRHDCQSCATLCHPRRQCFFLVLAHYLYALMVGVFETLKFDRSALK